MKKAHLVWPLLWLSTATAPGCGPVEDTPFPEQASSCALTLAGELPDTRGVALGDGSSEGFEPWSDGEEVEKVLGSQGLRMITPTVRVEPRSADPDNMCLRVRLEETSGFSSQWNVRFVGGEGGLFSDGALYFPTEAEGEVTLTLTVQGEGFSGSQALSVVFR